jgi:arylsulfatase A-like enzyme
MQFMKMAALIGGCALALSCGGCGGDSDAPAPSKPNILMILADDLGYSDIGAFGGEIQTPNLDALAQSGRLLTNFHAAGSCSPTRSMLMTGTDHHLVGLGTMAETVIRMVQTEVAPFGASNTYGFNNLPPGYEGYLSDAALSMPRLLRDAGYHTYMAGKWHLATVAAAGPSRYRAASFPNAKGFERSFALLQGAAPHFAPVPGRETSGDLAVGYIEDDIKVTLPANFYSSTGFTDKIISYIESNRRDGKPFFAYAAYTAPHWPVQAPDEDIVKYAGKYDEGYEVIRSRRLAKQKALGIVPADFNANPGLSSPPGRPRWESLTPGQRATEARKMEVYAAMVDNLDRNIGRLIQYLKDTGQYENTLIMFASDNGAATEPSTFADDANTDNSLANIGRRRSNVGYGERWAEVSATPFRMFKTYATEGGVSVPAIMRLPNQAQASAIARDLAHVSDLLPTFLEAAGIAEPGARYDGRAVRPITGISLLARLQDRSGVVRGSGSVLADELFGGRYIIRDQWKMVSIPQAPFGNGNWMLFDLSKDRAETNDLAATRPDLVRELTQAYEDYAARSGVVFAASPLRRSPEPSEP